MRPNIFNPELVEFVEPNEIEEIYSSFITVHPKETFDLDSYYVTTHAPMKLSPDHE
jgi:hypothetical protein